VKKFIKNNSYLFKFLVSLRDLLRIFYNQKRRSRFFWNLRNGDTKLSLDYDFQSHDIIFDVGAHIGSFTEKLLDKFDCIVFAFEPKKEFYEILLNKFEDKENVKIFNFALSNFNGKTSISDIGAGSSLVSRAENLNYEEIEVRMFSEFIKKENIRNIDLLYLNIEGSEYELLDDILKNNLQNKINHFQIQFHNFVKDSPAKRKEIRKILKNSHFCKFNFPFIWERWDLRSK